MMKFFVFIILLVAVAVIPYGVWISIGIFLFWFFYKLSNLKEVKIELVFQRKQKEYDEEILEQMK